MAIETVQRSFGREKGRTPFPVSQEPGLVKIHKGTLRHGVDWRRRTNFTAVTSSLLSVQQAIGVGKDQFAPRAYENFYEAEEINTRHVKRRTRVREPKKPWNYTHLAYTPDKW